MHTETKGLAMSTATDLYDKFHTFQLNTAEKGQDLVVDVVERATELTKKLPDPVTEQLDKIAEQFDKLTSQFDTQFEKLTEQVEKFAGQLTDQFDNKFDNKFGEEFEKLAEQFKGYRNDWAENLEQFRERIVAASGKGTNTPEA